jgi:hypothetical protein
MATVMVGDQKSESALISTSCWLRPIRDLVWVLSAWQSPTASHCCLEKKDSRNFECNVDNSR